MPSNEELRADMYSIVIKLAAPLKQAPCFTSVFNSGK